MQFASFFRVLHNSLSILITCLIFVQDNCRYIKNKSQKDPVINLLMSQKQFIPQLTRLATDNSPLSRHTDTFTPLQSHRSAGASKSKFQDSWKSFILPQFKEDQQIEWNKSTTTLKSERKMNTSNKSYKADSSDKIKEKSVLIDMPENMKRRGGFGIKVCKDEPVSFGREDRKKKSRITIPPEKYQHLIEENALLREEVEYLRKKFEKCLMKKNKPARRAFFI